MSEYMLLISAKDSLSPYVRILTLSYNLTVYPTPLFPNFLDV